jgi:ribosomal protein S18 acetylase RimI-like enzyme
VDNPDLNLFMMCAEPAARAFRTMPAGYHVRSMRPDELGIWKAFPFDDAGEARAYEDFMTRFFDQTYGRNEELFFRNTLFACDSTDRPVATCSSWKAYGAFQSIHWWKTLKSHEGRGLGRALLSAVLRRFSTSDYPVFLHTQPGSFRAIKLYSDFGFKLLSGERLGVRKNDWAESLPILKALLPPTDLARLKVVEPPQSLLLALQDESHPQF